MKINGFPNAILILSVFSASTFFAAQEKRSGSARPPADRVGVLTLPDGSTFATALYGMKVIGQLHTARKLPYFILAGTTCTECDENISIYIYSPSDGAMKNEAEQRRFAFPGRETDYETHRPVYEAKMFFGNCLATHPNAVVWFERALGKDKKWHSGVFVAEVKDDALVFSQLHDPLPRLPDAQDALRSGECHQVSGVDRQSEP